MNVPRLRQPELFRTPEDVRQALLEFAWKRHYFGLRRTAAAKAIALDWTEYMKVRGTRAPLDNVELIYEELARLRFRALQWRQIADIIDPDL